jgi:allantoinase
MYDHQDYCYHLAPIERQHIKEMGLAADKYGINTFKIFMFYGGK